MDNNNKALARLASGLASAIIMAVPTFGLAHETAEVASLFGVFLLVYSIMLYIEKNWVWQSLFGFVMVGAVGASIWFISPASSLGLYVLSAGWAAVFAELVSERITEFLSSPKTKAPAMVDEDGDEIEVDTAEELVEQLAAMDANQLLEWASSINPQFDGALKATLTELYALREAAKTAPAAAKNGAATTSNGTTPLDGTASLLTIMQYLLTTAKDTAGQPFNPVAIRWYMDKTNQILVNPKGALPKAYIQMVESIVQVHSTLPADKQAVKATSVFAAKEEDTKPNTPVVVVKAG